MFAYRRPGIKTQCSDNYIEGHPGVRDLLRGEGEISKEYIEYLSYDQPNSTAFTAAHLEGTELEMERRFVQRVAMAVAALLGAAVAVAGEGVGAETQLCAAPGATSVVMSVSTRRNSTGHWNIAVDVHSDAERRLAARPHERGVALTLGQRTAFCNLTDAVHLFATASVSSQQPPAGYELMLGQGYYRTSGSALAWQDAVRACEDEGAHLMVVNSELEANVVREFFARKPTFKNHSSSSYVQLGFHDRYKEGEFVTVYGMLLKDTGYLQWDSGQPSGGTSHNCGIANAYGRLMTHPCTNKYAYICEFGA